jgi:hypothetical protein
MIKGIIKLIQPVELVNTNTFLYKCAKIKSKYNIIMFQIPIIYAFI